MLDELDKTLRIDDETFLVFDMFNGQMEMRNKSAWRKYKVLLVFTKIRVPQNSTKLQLVFDDFKVAIAKIEKKRNEIMLALIKKGELNQNDVDKYKNEHPVESDKVYSLIVPDCKQYLEIMKLLKLSLLITSSTASVECDFPVLNLIHTKERYQLTAKSIDRLIPIILLGPVKLTKSEYEELIDSYSSMSNRCINLISYVYYFQNYAFL